MFGSEPVRVRFDKVRFNLVIKSSSHKVSSLIDRYNMFANNLVWFDKVREQLRGSQIVRERVRFIFNMLIFYFI